MRFILLILLASTPAYAEKFNARVIAVMDGDTVMVLYLNKKIKIRLVNIDAPESKQPFGKESRQALHDSVLKKRVQIDSRALDIYGRMIAEISVDGLSVNEEQVRSGMAWANSHFGRDKHYLALQREAQHKQRGLWGAAAQPIQPEQWRKLHPFINLSSTANASCGKKQYCAQMDSCDEANFYLKQCGLKSLDGNGDGVPCASLCLGEQGKLD